MIVGIGQMRVVGGAPGDNLARAESMIEAAAAARCDVVVLPECLDLGWTHPSARALAETIPGPRANRLADSVRKAQIHAVAGLTERDGNHIYNAAVLFAPDGEILLKHRKINILDIAKDLYGVGDHLSVAHTGLGPVGVLICADNFPDTLCLGRSLARMGAKTILSPCAWAVPPDHDNRKTPYGELWRGAYSTLASEFDIAIVGVSNVGSIAGGPWQGHRCIGCSMAVDSGGEVRFQAPYGEDAEGFFVVDL